MEVDNGAQKFPVYAIGSLSLSLYFREKTVKYLLSKTVLSEIYHSITTAFLLKYNTRLKFKSTKRKLVLFGEKLTLKKTAYILYLGRKLLNENIYSFHIFGYNNSVASRPLPV